MLTITSFSALPHELSRYSVLTETCPRCNARKGLDCTDPALAEGRVHKERFTTARARMLELLNTTAAASYRSAAANASNQILAG